MKRWRMSRTAVVVSALAHVALLFAASRGVQRAPVPVATTFEWVAVVETPREPVAPPLLEEPPAAPVPAEPAPEVAPQPPPRVEPPRPAAAPPSSPVAPPAIPPASPVLRPAVPSRADLDSARREAAAAVIGARERGGTLLAPSALDPPAAPPAKREPKAPSIFDRQSHAGGGVLSPGKARTAVGSRLGLWCSKVTGGFGFFGIPVCASGEIEPPSGIFADSIPEYLRLKPDCEEARPAAAALGESSPYPTVKCRLVPKAADER